VPDEVYVKLDGTLAKLTIIEVVPCPEVMVAPQGTDHV
jgi:hypothetical protein